MKFSTKEMLAARHEGHRMSSLVVYASVVVAWLFDDKDKLRANRVLDRRVEEHAPLVQRSRDIVAGKRP